MGRSPRLQSQTASPKVLDLTAARLGAIRVQAWRPIEIRSEVRSTHRGIGGDCGMWFMNFLCEFLYVFSNAQRPEDGPGVGFLGEQEEGLLPRAPPSKVGASQFRLGGEKLDWLS
jgi:hypothetical protein